MVALVLTSGLALAVNNGDTEEGNKKHPKEAGAALPRAGDSSDDQPAASPAEPALRGPLNNNPTTDGSKNR
jgi:hypothetical protein